MSRGNRKGSKGAPKIQTLMGLHNDANSNGVDDITKGIVKDVRNFIATPLTPENRHYMYSLIEKVDNTVGAAMDFHPTAIKNSYRGLKIDQEAKKNGYIETPDFLKNAEAIASEIRLSSLIELIFRSLLLNGDYIAHVIYADKEKRVIKQLEYLPPELVTIVDKDHLDENLANTSNLSPLTSDIAIREPDYYLVNEFLKSEAPAANVEDTVKRYPRSEIFHVGFKKTDHHLKDRMSRDTFGIWGRSPMESVLPYVKGKVLLFTDHIRWAHNAVPRWDHSLDLSELMNPDNTPGATRDASIDGALQEVSKLIESYKKSLKYVDDDRESATFGKELELEPNSQYVHTNDVEINCKSGGSPGTMVVEVFQLCDREIAKRLGVSMVLAGYEEGSTYAVGKVGASFMAKIGGMLLRSFEDDFKSFLEAQMKNRGILYTPADLENLYIDLEVDDSETAATDAVKNEKKSRILSTAASGISTLVTIGVLSRQQAFKLLGKIDEDIGDMKFENPEVPGQTPATQPGQTQNSTTTPTGAESTMPSTKPQATPPTRAEQISGLSSAFTGLMNAKADMIRVRKMSPESAELEDALLVALEGEMEDAIIGLAKENGIDLSGIHAKCKRDTAVSGRYYCTDPNKKKKSVSKPSKSKVKTPAKGSAK